MSTDAIQFAGEFAIEELKIVTPTEQVADLISDVLVIEINIFEDIFSNTLSGNIMLTDIRDIITLLPIQGQEELFLKIKTPSLSDPNDVLDFSKNPFVINKVSLRRIVDDLMKLDKSGIQTSKEVFVEPTLGTRNYVVPNSNPFTFISKLTKEAISENGSPHYLFFENKKGFHFKTFQFLYKEAQEKGVRGEFHVGDKGFDEETTADPDSGKNIQNYKRVIQYSLNSRKDLLINTTTGFFGGKVIEHNLYNKKLKTKTYNYFSDEDFNANERISSNRLYSDNAVQSLESLSDEEIENSNIHVIPISRDSTDKDMSYEKGDANQRYKTLLDRKSRLVEYQDGISINMTVHGQTTMTVGDMVNVSIPAVGSEDEIEDKLYSGTYLITKLRHTFNPSTRSHVMSMELVKDGLGEGLESGETSSNIPSTTTQTKKIRPNAGVSQVI